MFLAHLHFLFWFSRVKSQSCHILGDVRLLRPAGLWISGTTVENIHESNCLTILIIISQSNKRVFENLYKQYPVMHCIIIRLAKIYKNYLTPRCYGLLNKTHHWLLFYIFHINFDAESTINKYEVTLNLT